MEYVLTLALILLLVFIFNSLNSRRIVKTFNRMVYTQSSIHEIVKDFLPKNTMTRKKSIKSQSKKHASVHMVKIVVIDGKAYWVKNNVFYTADIHEGEILHETATPVDTLKMSREELDKMIFILDNLGRGDEDERSGSGND